MLRQSTSEQVSGGKSCPKKNVSVEKWDISTTSKHVLMRRDLEEWNSSSSSEPSFSNESGLPGRLLAGTSHSKSLKQPHQASSSRQDQRSNVSRAHSVISLLHLSRRAMLAEKGASCPILFLSPDTSSKRPSHCSPPSSLLHLHPSHRQMSASRIPPWLFSPSQPFLGCLSPPCHGAVHQTVLPSPELWGSSFSVPLFLESYEVQPHPKILGCDLCGSQGEFCIPDGISAAS